MLTRATALAVGDMDDDPLWPGLVPAILLALIALASIALPLWFIATAPEINGSSDRIVKPTKVAPKAVLPEVEPVALQAVSTNEAVAFNATIPFSSAPNPAARPFRFAGGPVDLERAINCLAAAVLFEAGDDREGQESVAQVVLNRVRHPAFPSTICGVVFQGSERRTGCQFTFTCDGALRRRYSDALWDRARTVATAAIGGAVYKPVGHATHYHTDWVVPYWSSSLDKITAVKTHLFFRWTGWWGTPPAFSSRSSTVEPAVAKLAAFFPAHAVGDGSALPLIGTLAAAEVPKDALPTAIQADRDTFITALDPRMAPDEFAVLAKRVCGDRGYCKFLAWSKAGDVPTVSAANLPADSPALQSMSFSYLRDRSRRFEKALWNCAQHPRDLPAECMRRRVPVPAATAAAVQAEGGLSGVRRKSEAVAPVDPLVSKSE